MIFNSFQLSEVCSRLSSGKSITSKQISDSGSYPVYGGNGRRGYTDTKNFSGECVIIGRQGAFCGNVRYFSGDAYMSEHAIVVCANEKANTRYLAYLLSTMNLGRLSTQSAQPGLSVKTLQKQIVKLPSVSEQTRIADFLSSFDDKIETNNKIIKTLEEISSLIYRKIIQNPIKIIPLCEFCYIKNEKEKSENIDIETYLSTENILPYKMGTKLASSIPDYGSVTKYSKGDTLISNIRPYFQKIAFADCNGCFSNDVICFSPKTRTLCSFLYFTLWQDSFFDFMMKGSKGTKMPRGDKQHIIKYEIPIPNNESINQFINFADESLANISNLRNENKTLGQIRDLALSKLMSGEIELNS